MVGCMDEVVAVLSIQSMQDKCNCMLLSSPVCRNDAWITVAPQVMSYDGV